ncbi:unnamed protein product [Amoebophrya sp. A120]|nr:unnamed protein product [Amoebophrya sp. A120]|eukprot:GSA120T00016780001.1
MGGDSKYDLTPKLAQFLDSHLLLIVMNGLEKKEVYPAEVIKPEIIEVLRSRTDLVSILQDKDPNNNYNDELRASADKVEAQKRELAPLLSKLESKGIGAVENPETGELQSADSSSSSSLHEQLMNVNGFQGLADLGLSKDHLDGYYTWCLSLYNIGLYDQSIENLAVYEKLYTKVMAKELEILQAQLPPGDPVYVQEKKNFNARLLSVKWGMLAGYIATECKDAEAAAQILALDEFLEEPGSGLSKKAILIQRTWLQHWMLFVLFRDGDLESAHSQIQRVMELFLSEKYLALISLMCPHMLRYAAAVFLLNKKLKPMLKDLIHVLNQDKQNYADPLTEFLLALHQDLDFETAKKKLDELQIACNNDYFLWGDNLTVILANARLAIFSIYCRIHQSVDISTIADKMSMPAEMAEQWIVELIQTGKLSGACIDSDANGTSSVFFPKEETEIYQQVLEKTQNMAFRLRLLQVNAEGIKDKNALKKVTQVSGKLAAHLG